MTFLPILNFARFISLTTSSRFWVLFDAKASWSLDSNSLIFCSNHLIVPFTSYGYGSYVPQGIQTVYMSIPNHSVFISHSGRCDSWHQRPLFSPWHWLLLDKNVTFLFGLFFLIEVLFEWAGIFLNFLHFLFFHLIFFFQFFQLIH